MARTATKSPKKLKDLDPEQVKQFAVALASKYKNTDVVIGLSGDLGAGKTYFTKCFAEKFGIKKIKSPTFIVGSVYKFQDRQLYHYDLYRLDNPKQLEPLELDEILSNKNRIVLIEWVDKFPDLAKKCDLIIKFEITGKNTRDVTLV